MWSLHIRPLYVKQTPIALVFLTTMNSP